MSAAPGPRRTPAPQRSNRARPTPPRGRATRNRGRRKVTVNRPKPKKGPARTEPKAMGKSTPAAARMARELPQPAGKRPRTQPGLPTGAGSRGQLKQEKRNTMPAGGQPKERRPIAEFRRKPPPAQRSRQPVRFGSKCELNRGESGRRRPRRTSTSVRRGPHNARPEKPRRGRGRQTRPRTLSALPGARCGRLLIQANAPDRSRPLSGTARGQRAVTRQRSSRRGREKASVRGAAKGMRPRVARGARAGRRPASASVSRLRTTRKSLPGAARKPRMAEPNRGPDDMPKSRRAARDASPGMPRRRPR